MDNNQNPTSYEHIPPRPQFERPRERSRLPGLLLVLIVLVALWRLPGYMEQIAYSRAKGEVQAIREELPSFQLRELSRAYTLMAKVIGPSVVHIDVSKDNYTENVRAQGQGSGVIVDEAGYIVTNNHVIENFDTARVNLADGRSFPARLVGRDPRIDLAVLKIEADGLIAAQWGDSDALQVGELVWAVGNPFGLDRTLTSGIISAKERRVNTGGFEQEFLQTDAAVNPGNSGGPLVDVDGKIVGINTAIIGPAFAGVGFAIPSVIARAKYDEIRENGSSTTVQRSGFIGVVPMDITPRIARRLGLPTNTGALIVDVVPEGPAAQAGIRPGDVIVRWGDTDVQNMASLILLASRSEIGSKVDVGLIRDGEELSVEITVGERPITLEESQ